MSQNIDPFLIPIPQAFLQDDEVRQYFEYKDRVIHDLYKRTGGASDLVAENQSIGSTNFYAAGLMPDNVRDYNFELPEETKKEYFYQLFEDENLKGEQSTGNTTTATLAGGATFTGTAEQNDYSDVMCSCYSDVAGTLYFDFSVNGTDWRTFPSVGFAVAAGIHEFHTAVKGPRWFRVRFVNGAAAQSTFQLYSYFGSFRQPNAPLNHPYSLDSDSQLTRPSWTWLDVARGLASGVKSIKKFGRNDGLGSATTFEIVALGGIYRMPQAASATALRIKAGGNANDTSAGSGARQVTVEGLDENFEFVSEALTTAGASASSATTATFTRLFRAYITPDVGSGTYSTGLVGSHSDDIVIEDSAGTQDWLTIDSTDFAKGQSEIGCYTIPAGKTGFVRLRDVSVDSGRTIDLLFFSRANADETAAPYTGIRTQSVISGVSGGSIETFGSLDVPFGPYVGPTDIGFLGKGASNPTVSIEFEIILIDN